MLRHRRTVGARYGRRRRLKADGLVDLVDINVTGGVLSPTNLESILGDQFRAE